MPSGQRFSHYKDFIAGLQPSFGTREDIRNAYNTSELLNDSYANCMAMNMPPHPRTLNNSVINSGEMVAGQGSIFDHITADAIEEYPSP